MWQTQGTNLSTVFYFFFNDTATTEIYTLSLHDALPICIISPAILSNLESIADVEKTTDNKQVFKEANTALELNFNNGVFFNQQTYDSFFVGGSNTPGETGRTSILTVPAAPFTYANIISKKVMKAQNNIKHDYRCLMKCDSG